MTIISDSNFPNPTVLNAIDCVSSSRYLNKVDESVSIINVCQDSQNPSLVIVSTSLIGAFLFTPFCKILSVDGDTSYTTLDIEAPIAVGHYRNADIPIDTHCITANPEIVFDFGRVIPNFLSCSTIVFTLGMVGTVPQSFGVNFQPQTPTVTYTWTKGVLPRPIGLSYSNDSLMVTFQYDGSKDCSCSIQCVQPLGVSRNLKFCPNETQALKINTSLSGDPYTFTLALQDSVGNTSSIVITSVYNVIPRAPSVSFASSPNRVEIFTDSLSANGMDLGEAQYQIINYAGTVSNHVVWKDWSDRPQSYFIDRDVLPNQIYGYAVRYRGKFNDISNLSSWTTIST